MLRPETVAIHAGAGRINLVHVDTSDTAATIAKSLGGVESLIERRAPGLLRLSVGCEHVEDLWDDLERAL